MEASEEQVQNSNNNGQLTQELQSNEGFDNYFTESGRRLTWGGINRSVVFY
jgi:hypothetical protein